MKNRDRSGHFKPGVSGNPAGRPKRVDGSKRIDSVPPTDTGHLRFDAWSNSMTGMGSSTRDKRLWSTFTADPVTPDEAIEMQRGDDLAARIVETLPHEMLREGYVLSIKDDDGAGDKAALITNAWDTLGMDAAFEEALKYERGGGGGAVFIGANDGQADLTQPLDVERVTSLDWLTALEASELVPVKWYTNPSAPKFGKVAVYRLSPLRLGNPVEKEAGALAPQMVDVHESRFIVFPGIRVSRRQQSSVLAGWGDSVLMRCRAVLRDFNMSWSSAAVLLHDFAQAVFGMEGLAELMTQTDGARLLRERMQTMDMSRSTARAIIIDSKETFERKSTPVTGLPDLLDRFSARLAAAADMPLTLLMGQSPGGLNATGASDVRFFYDRVSSIQKRKLLPAIKRITRILFRVFGGAEPKKWSITFNSLWQPTEAENAGARKTQAETDQIYITNQVATPEEIAHSRFSGNDYSFATEIDFDERDAAGAPLATDPAAEGLRDPSVKVEAGTPVATGTPVQATAYNGSQITSAIDIVAKVNEELISRESGIALLSIMFPITPAQAASIIGTKMAKPEPPTPFGGAPNGKESILSKPAAEGKNPFQSPASEKGSGPSPIEPAATSTPKTKTDGECHGECGHDVSEVDSHGLCRACSVLAEPSDEGK